LNAEFDYGVLTCVPLGYREYVRAKKLCRARSVVPLEPEAGWESCAWLRLRRA
jgi:hypothetical protein